MNVIWHDDVTANSPAMAAIGHAPFVDQNFGDLVASEDFLRLFVHVVIK
jgi:hypothetical protein